MRALGFLALLFVLPLAARAQTDPSAPVVAPTEGEVAPPQSPYTPGAAPAPPAEVAQPAPAPVAAPEPAPVAAPAAVAAPAPVAAPVQAPASYAPQQPQAPYAAPPPAAFTPRPSPLLQPQYGSAAPPVYALPTAPIYAPPTAPAYAPPMPQLYSPPPPVYVQAQPVYTTPAPAATVYPPPLSLPALPQGYVYLPMPLGVAPTLQAPLLQLPMQQQPLQPTSEQARREALYRQLQALDSRLDQLQRTRVGVGGPITLMILSYGTALVAGAVSASSFDSAHDIKHGTFHHGRDLDFNDNGVVDHHDYRSFVRAGRISGGIAGAGLLLGFASTVRLFKNIGLRRAQASELRDLADQRGRLVQQLDYGASFSSNQLQLSLGGRF